MKICIKCNTDKDIGEFYSTIRKSGATVYSSACRSCHGIAKRTCIACGIEFIGRRNAKLCSDACRASHRPKTFKQCDHCHSTFGPVSKLSVRYCSIECKSKAQIGAPSPSRGIARPHTHRARVGACLVCSKEFRAVNDFGSKKQVYCSYGCYLKNRRTSLFEISVGRALDILGIETVPQVRIGRWHVDLQLAGTRILVEADGSYWHSTDKVIERDARKSADLAAMGYELFRVDELDFHVRGAESLRHAILRWQDYTGRRAVHAVTGEPFPGDGEERQAPPELPAAGDDIDLF